ncbi:MAG: ribonuclease III domain-containing protein [Clostridiaceae bacterium]|nr:ribonuclease III domain-containing protein [Clostridiaceae bacterium]
MTREQVGRFPTLTLAHIGDCVYELLARSYVVHLGAYKAYETHRRTVAIVSAESQYKGAKTVLDSLSCDEKAIFGRGRNAKPKSIPRHASPEEYAYATGLEALFGHLYLTGQDQRIQELWDIIIKGIEE